MSTGFQAAFDRLRTLAADDLSLIADATGRTTLVEHPRRLDLEATPDSGLHRRFHVIWSGAEALPNRVGDFAGSTLDDVLTATVQVAYYEGGGDAEPYADALGVDRLAMDDHDRLRQHLEHPANRDSDNTGIVRVDWMGTRRLGMAPGHRARIYESSFRVWVRHARLS